MGDNRLYPDFFPEGCPPEDAISKSLEVYRFVYNNDRVTDKDFKSHYEMGKIYTKKEEIIQSCGLSVNPDLNEFKKFQKTSPALKKLFIAKGYITEKVGTIKHTPSRTQSNHHTWWKYKEIKPENHFEIYEEE
ncbi:MAG: hypothetical protein ACRC30_11160 [Clostridium sp.]